VGEPEHKGDFSFTVASVDGSIVGIISKDATLTTEINGVSVKLADTKAGRFDVEVPHPGTGEFEITVTADNNGNTLSDTVIIPALDEDAPAQPEIGMDEDDSLYVNTVPDKNDLVDVTVNVSEYIPLSSANAAVAVGSTEANTPMGIDPTLLGYGEFTDSLTTIVEDGTNPYQVFKVELDTAEASWRFSWQGTSDRQLHAYAYNASLGEWTKITSSVGTGDITMNIEIEGTEYLSGNTLYLMIFRGLGQELAEMTSFIPEENQYDFTMFWNSDTQYLGQFAENMLYHQHEWIADNFEDKKGVITFNTGDVSNRTNLNYEYNWEVVDNSYNIFEEAGIPYTFNWGNHDLNYDSQPNETRYNRLYFPTSRLDENKGGWEVSYAPDAKDGTTTRAMAYKQTIDGAKIMILSLAYNSYLTESDLTWAEQTLAANPDYTVIIITHNYASNSAIKDTNIRTRLADVYPNVKLVLCGHLDGTAVHKDTNGSFVVLQDYQGESGKVKHGGNEFLKLIQFDVENDLIYFNTYSPLTGETLSPIGEKPDAEAEGLYQKNGDEFALNIELNGDKTRSFTTTALTLSSGKVEFTHTVRITEGDSVKIAPKGLTA
ncbi:MAG: metallophosphoesterase, partial [Clostridia bacterium]|nr:metallophosphoesterase [Clostridia bacterium]